MSGSTPGIERPSDLTGRVVAGKYSIQKLIGKGGMGAVYEAEHIGIGKRVAIKFVDPEFAKDEQVVSRFAREARASSSIESAHIVSVFDAGTEDGRPYIVMELLRGEDLGRRLRRDKRVDVKDALHIIAQVLKGLGHAHAAGIVHRDLKPDNIFLSNRDGDPLSVKIVDFGISKIFRPSSATKPLELTQQGTVIGTPLYMSPEQAQALTDVDARADLFSVGAILFECLSGRPPHPGESYEQIIISICTREAPDLRAVVPSVSDDVAELVRRALERDRAQRFQSARSMLQALHEIQPEEKTKVPLDVVPETLASANALPLPASGSTQASAPASEIVAGPATGVSWSGAKKVVPLESERPQPQGPSRAVVVITALFATLLGMGVTVGVLLSRKAPPAAGASTAQPTASQSATATPIANPTATATTTSTTTATTTMTATATATTTAAGTATFANAAATSTVKPVTTATATTPKPVGSGKSQGKDGKQGGGLDLQRDFP